MKIIGNDTSVQFFVEQEADIPLLIKISDLCAPYGGSFATAYDTLPDGSLKHRGEYGIEVMTNKLLAVMLGDNDELVQARMRKLKEDLNRRHVPASLPQ